MQYSNIQKNLLPLCKWSKNTITFTPSFIMKEIASDNTLFATYTSKEESYLHGEKNRYYKIYKLWVVKKN